MVWVLRRPADIAQVICIPSSGEFSIGRIECSFNISDDKSVSRRHATLVSDPLRTDGLILTDQNSKFGTFVNGEKIESSRRVCGGDVIKFGGAGSEFVIESRDLSAFVKDASLRARLDPLARKFGFELVESTLSDAAYYILCETRERELLLDADLMEALLEAKPVVSPAYHLQLQSDSNAFSLGLVHPSVDPPSTLFTLNAWVPRKDRRSALRDAFDGIRRFVYMGGECREGAVIEAFGRALRIETRVIYSDGARDSGPAVHFNELIVNTGDFVLPDSQIGPIRVVTYRSMIEALLRCDPSKLDIETVINTKTNAEDKTVDKIIDKPFEKIASKTNYESVTKVTGDVSVTKVTDNLPLYSGPSLTAVIPMPSTFLRSSSAVSAPLHRPSKFVKCHPKHRQPGTIPALIGPDQLAPKTLPSPSEKTQPNGKRYLVRDAWLVEDDSKEAVVLSDGEEDVVPVVAVKAVNATKFTDAKIPPQSKENISKQINPTTTTNTTTTTTSSSSSSSTPSIAKFQSSFFKNLSKKP